MTLKSSVNNFSKLLFELVKEIRVLFLEMLFWVKELARIELREAVVSDIPSSAAIFAATPLRRGCRPLYEIIQKGHCRLRLCC